MCAPPLLQKLSRSLPRPERVELLRQVDEKHLCIEIQIRKKGMKVEMEGKRVGGEVTGIIYGFHTQYLEIALP